MQIEKFFTISVTREDINRVKEFKFMNGNRTLNYNNVKEKEIEFKKHSRFLNEITVNIETNNILDGQHRVKAYLNLIEKQEIPNFTKLDVKYIKLNNISELEYCIDVNSSSHNWRNIDFIETNKSLNKYTDVYNKLDALFQNAPRLKFEKNKTLISTIGAPRQKAYRRVLLMLKYRKGIKGFNIKNINNEFRLGKLLITDEEITFANTIIQELTQILDTIGYGAPSGLESLVKSWIEIRDDYAFHKWLKAFKCKGDNIARQPKDRKGDWDSIFEIASSYIMKGK
jgi:hypothetical protein